jgi:transposase
MGQVIEIKLSVEEREELEALVGRPSEEAGLVRRARVILLSNLGVSGREIALRLDLSPEHVSKVRTWFRTGGVGGLRRPRSGRKDHAVLGETVDRIVQLAMSPPPAGRSRWTTRLRGKELGLTSGCISDVLRKNGLKPHLVRTYTLGREYADRLARPLQRGDDLASFSRRPTHGSRGQRRHRRAISLTDRVPCLPAGLYTPLVDGLRIRFDRVTCDQTDRRHGWDGSIAGSSCQRSGFPVSLPLVRLLADYATNETQAAANSGAVEE